MFLFGAFTVVVSLAFAIAIVVDVLVTRRAKADER